MSEPTGGVGILLVIRTGTKAPALSCPEGEAPPTFNLSMSTTPCTPITIDPLYVDRIRFSRVSRINKRHYGRDGTRVFTFSFYPIIPRCQERADHTALLKFKPECHLFAHCRGSGCLPRRASPVEPMASKVCKVGWSAKRVGLHYTSCRPK